jgi:hypothetical protein
VPTTAAPAGTEPVPVGPAPVDEDVRPHARRWRQDLAAGLAVAVRLTTASASMHATVEAPDSMRATVAALERAMGSAAVGGARGATTGADELALPASISPAGVLPASLSGGTDPLGRRGPGW